MTGGLIEDKKTEKMLWKLWKWLTGGLMEGAADAGSSDIDRTAFKMETDQ